MKIQRFLGQPPTPNSDPLAPDHLVTIFNSNTTLQDFRMTHSQAPALVDDPLASPLLSLACSSQNSFKIKTTSDHQRSGRVILIQSGLVHMTKASICARLLSARVAVSGSFASATIAPFVSGRFTISTGPVLITTSEASSACVPRVSVRASSMACGRKPCIHLHPFAMRQTRPCGACSIGENPASDTSAQDPPRNLGTFKSDWLAQFDAMGDPPGQKGLVY